MTRLTSRTTSTFRREIASVVAEWERGSSTAVPCCAEQP